jgi:hypothetical protein
MRPTDGGETCVVSITPKSARFAAPIDIEVGDGWCRLAGPAGRGGSEQPLNRR